VPTLGRHSSRPKIGIAGSLLGYKHSDDAKDKMSESQKCNTNAKGAVRSEETRAKMSVAKILPVSLYSLVDNQVIKEFSSINAAAQFRPPQRRIELELDGLSQSAISLAIKRGSIVKGLRV
jgi:hypothetical protein